MQIISLIGFMGSGKTTIGKSLSKDLQLPVIDTDELIIKNEKMTINDIFEKIGEDHFRNLETEVLKTLSESNKIITTGGGIVLREENRLWLKSNTYVVFLHCDSEEILRRLKEDNTRPLLKVNKEASLKSLYEERYETYYKLADLRLDTTHKSVGEIVEEIKLALKSS